MTAVVTFNFTTWTTAYPEFASCTSAQGQTWFNLADLIFANEECNPAFSLGVDRFSNLLYLLTSHIAWLNAPRDAAGNPAATGQLASTLVGRINSATQGSVTVSTEYPVDANGREKWFAQTPWGALFWQATSQFRMFIYGANPTIVPGTFPSASYPYNRYPIRRRF